jgi:hypothetical protein
VILFIFQIVLDVVKSFKGTNTIILQRDNAGCFNSYLLFGCLSQLSMKFKKMKLIFQEPQCSKTIIDFHFSFFKRSIKQAMKMKSAKATTPFEVFQSIKERSICATTVTLTQLVELEIHNESEVKVALATVPQRKVVEV